MKMDKGKDDITKDSSEDIEASSAEATEETTSLEENGDGELVDATSEGADECTADGKASALQGKLDEVYGKQAELQSNYLRKVAELDNFRKRFAREREEIRLRARTMVIEDMLPALDAFRLGLEAASKNEAAKDMATGFSMAMKQLESALGEHGVVSLDPTGEPFDPALHEAVGQEESEEIEKGSVISTVRVGYKMGDHLLRAAAVIVSTDHEVETTEAEEESSGG